METKEGLAHIWQDMSQYGMGTLRFCKRCNLKELPDIKDKPCGGDRLYDWVNRPAVATGGNYDPVRD